jgi:hypothetical protein
MEDKSENVMNGGGGRSIDNIGESVKNWRKSGNGTGNKKTNVFIERRIEVAIEMEKLEQKRHRMNIC